MDCSTKFEQRLITAIDSVILKKKQTIFLTLLSVVLLNVKVLCNVHMISISTLSAADADFIASKEHTAMFVIMPRGGATAYCSRVVCLSVCLSATHISSLAEN